VYIYWGQPDLLSQKIGFPGLRNYVEPPTFLPTPVNVFPPYSAWWHKSGNVCSVRSYTSCRHCIFTKASRGFSAISDILVAVIDELPLQR